MTSLCEKCFTRFDACAECKDAEIARLNTVVAEYEHCRKYALSLAEAIHKKHYQNEAPNWEPMASLVGILTQIDNMSCGLEKPKTETDAEITALRERIADLESSLELAYVGIKEMERQHEYCDCSDDPQDDICIGCNLRKVLVDMEAQQ